MFGVAESEGFLGFEVEFLGLSDFHADEGFVDSGNHPALTNDDEAWLVGFLLIKDVFGFSYVFFGCVENTVIIVGVSNEFS